MPLPTSVAHVEAAKQTHKPCLRYPLATKCSLVDKFSLSHLCFQFQRPPLEAEMASVTGGATRDEKRCTGSRRRYGRSGRTRATTAAQSPRESASVRVSRAFLFGAPKLSVEKSPGRQEHVGPLNHSNLQQPCPLTHPPPTHLRLRFRFG